MGQKDDAVIELQPPVRIWVVEVLHENGMTPTESGVTGIPTPKEEAPKGPTPAQILLQKVSAPRPQDLSVPEGANSEEANAIGTLYSQLLGNLQTHDGGDDLTLANSLIGQIREAGAKVPLRIAREIEDRRKEVLGAHGLLKLPEGLPEAERGPLAESLSALGKSIAEAVGMEALDGLAKDVTGLTEKIRLAGEAVNRRGLEAAALRLRIDKAAPPEGALPGESAPLKERGEKLVLTLAPPLSDEGLQGTTSATALLEQDAKQLAEAVTKRAEAAQALRLRLDKIAPASGLPEDEAQAFRSKVSEAANGLAKPHDPAALDKVEKAAVDLEKEALQQGVAVAERKVRADKLALRLGNIKAPARVMPDEALALRKDADDAAMLLAAPHSVLTLDGVEKTAGELEGRAVTLAESVVKRDERAKAVSLRMTQLVDPPGLNDSEKGQMKDAREAASLLLTDPPTEKGLGDAESKATDAENLGKTIGKAISDRVLKRKELTDELGKLVLPPGARPTDFRLRSKAGAEIRKTIADANTSDALVKAEEAVTAEKKIVADLVQFIQERLLAEGELAAARVTLKGAEQTADQGYVVTLRGTIFDTAKALPGISTLTDLAKLRKDLADVLLLQVQSEAYADDFRAFLIGSAACEAAATPVNKPTVTAAIKQVRLAAQAKAVTCNYVDARKELAKFESLAGLGSTAMADATLWINAAKAFAATHDTKLKLIKGSQVPDGPRLLLLVANARKVPAAGTSVPNAILALNNLKTDIDGLYDVAVLWQRYKGINQTDVNTARTNATVHLNTQDYDEAVKEFDPLNGTAHEAKGNDKERLAGMNSRKDSMLARLVDPQKSLVSGKWNTAKTKVANDTTVNANAAMDDVETLMNDLEPWLPLANEVKALRAKNDPDPAQYGLTADADAKATSNLYGQAIPLLGIAKAKLTALPEAKALIAQVEALRDAQVATTPPHTACVNALAAAATALTPEKDPVKAINLLRVVLADPGLKAMAADIAVWQSRYPVAKKATDAAAKMMDLPDPKKVLTDSLAAALAQATQHKYREALDLLDLHEPVLKLSATYAATRRRALDMFKALLRAEVQFPAETLKIFGAKGKAALEKMRDDAEVLAAKKDFAPAIKAFQDLLDECKVQCKDTAELFEDADAENTNAGHALESHGAHTKEEDHLQRLQTGVAPDGRASKTKTTTQYTDPAAFLASREKGMEQATNEPPPPLINFADNTFPLNIDEKLLKKQVAVEHGAGIGKALIGVKLTEELMPDGTIDEADRKFESWQNLDGMTKSKVLFTFEFDSPDPTVNPKSPRNVDDYKKRYKEQKERENKKAQDDYDLLPLPKGAAPTPQSTVPPNLPGRWVCMQNFPEAADWDQEKGEYVE